MPSKQLGSLIVAIAFALVAVFLFIARDTTGGWRVPSIAALSDVGAQQLGMSPTETGVENSKRASSEKASQQARQKLKLSKDITDGATGLKLPRTKRFSKVDLTCLGVGVRSKSIAVARVNVYTVGLYVDPRAAKGALKKFKGVDASKIRNDRSFYDTLLTPSFTKYLHLVFARSVGAQKVVDALTSVMGVEEKVLKRFSSLLLDAVGKEIGRKESISLGWEGKGKMVVFVRDKLVGTITDVALPKAVFDLYLGSSPVSPAAKAAFAEGIPDFLSD